jgi:glutaredoxin/glutathione-dependent peroxiredoxin
MIEVGQKIPSIKVKRANEEAGDEIDTAAFFAGKKVILFSLPGAFTPTCSQKHLPGYVKELPQLRAKGIDMVACLSVNDAHVMREWAKQHDALGKIEMICDGNADLSKALGIESDLAKAYMGMRCRRGLIVLDDGVVKSIEMEAPGKFEVSSAEACMLKLGA